MPPVLVDFMTELARTVQRYSMYPAGHPARESTVKQAIAGLEALLGDHSRLKLGISRDRLTIGSVETDPQNTLLSGFAGRLYEHQLISITFIKGVEEKEISAFLDAISVQIGTTGEPLGTGPPEQLNLGPHLKLEPVSYDTISLAEEGVVKERAKAGGMAGAQLQDEGAYIDTSVGETAIRPDADDQDSAAASTGEAAMEPGSTEQLDEDLAGVAVALPEGEELDAETARQRISRLILSLDPATLRQLTEALPDEMRAGGLEIAITRAVTEFIVSAVSGSGDEPSAALLRTLTKMGMRGEAPPAEPTDAKTAEVLSRLVGQLGGEWQMQDTTPEDYKEQLREFSQDAPILKAISAWLEEPKAERVVQMGLELDNAGPAINLAAISMTEDGELNRLLDLLESSPEDTSAADDLWQLVTTPEMVTQIVGSEPLDFSILDRMIPRLGSDAAAPILHVLSESESRTMRLELIERLVMVGPKIGPLVVERLEDERWYVRRNMLVLLNRLPSLPEGFSPEPHLVDPKPQVRREAMKLALFSSAEPEVEVLIVAALLDSDQQVVALGLEAAEQECPPTVVPHVVKLVLDPKSAMTLRLAGIRTLSSSDSPEALQALLRLTWVRKLVLLRRLASKSAVMLEALAALVKSWAENPRAKRVLHAASKAKDPQIRSVARKARATK